MLLSCKLKTLCHTLLAVLALLLYCEYLHYYVVLLQCGWPHSGALFTVNDLNQMPLKVMIIADTHLLGRRHGHWFDKLRREWQMECSFQTSLWIFQPNVVFILGDLFDEGMWSSDDEFKDYVRGFRKIFRHSNNTRLYVVAGNHDIGFHYMIDPERDLRFRTQMSSPNVQMLRISGNMFVLINSMALEGDRCQFCAEAESKLSYISNELSCSKSMSTNDALDQYCDKNFVPYVKPIIMQHFPMYRKSEANCSTPDADMRSSKHKINRLKLDVLSKEATKKLFDWLNPRLVLSAHTHHGCYREHKDGTPEWTVPSFNWRNKKNPAFLLMTVSPQQYRVSRCFLPDERTVIALYSIGGLAILLYFIVIPKILFYRKSRSSKLS